MKKKILFVLACVSILFCMLAISVSAENIDPNADYHDKVYTDLNGREFPIYEKDGDTYHPLVWFAYDDAETGEKKYVSARFTECTPLSHEASQGRLNGLSYTYTTESGEEMVLNASNIIVLNLRDGKLKGGQPIKTFERRNSDPSYSQVEAIYLPLSFSGTFGYSFSLSTLRVLDFDKNHKTAVSIQQHIIDGSKIQEIFIPGSATFVGNGQFQNCASLEKIVFGEGFNGGVEMMPYTFANAGNIKMICYLGDYVSASTNSNGVYHKLTKLSYAEYDALEDKSGKYIVYNATQCLAFGHDILMDERVLVGNDFFSEIAVACPCGVEGCGATVTVSTIAPMFADNGYSAKNFGEGYAIVQSYFVNRTAILEYQKYAEVEFGVVATVNAGGEAIAPVLGGEGVYSASLWDAKANDYLEIIVNNIPNNTEKVENGEEAVDNKDKNIIFCLYVLKGESVWFLDGGKTVQSLSGISYQTVLNNTEK